MVEIFKSQVLSYQTTIRRTRQNGISNQFIWARDVPHHSQKMGSFDGNNGHRSRSRSRAGQRLVLLLRDHRFHVLIAFVGGCVCSWIAHHLSTGLMQPIMTQLLYSVAKSLKGSGSSCQVSFGEFRGHEYRTNATVGTPICLVESKFMKVQQHQVRISTNDAAIIPDWLWIDYHDRINVLVEDHSKKRGTKEERHFLVFEQSKYALEGRNSFAIVGGIIEPNEKPEGAARREVAEEMKMTCDVLHFLGRYRTDVNRGVGWTFTYLCAASPVSSKAVAPNSVPNQSTEVGAADSERQDLKRLSLAELREAVREGKFLEIQWTATVALALMHPALQ
jgi:8-oxo-dGTP pyrophosphatase MutT (NUDIX family)